jgi:site-specific recombinase XerC
MCIRIYNSDLGAKYDSSVPLDMQIQSADRIVVKYEQKDPDIDKFLSEMERLCRTGVSANVNVEVVHNNHLKGAKALKQVKRLMKDLNVNEAIKLLVNLQQKTDIALEELATYCQKR